MSTRAARTGLRTLLWPFSIIYGLLTGLRNWVYNVGWINSYSAPVPTICIGNLSVGGTGKTPMIEWMAHHLASDYKTAVLSRGYGRKTNGFIHVERTHTAEEVGDEPLQIALKFPDITVAVCENRKRGIENLLQLSIPPQLILLDDAFQHRGVNAKINVLLTSHGDLYIDDSLLPSGNLREYRRGARRANIIIVTKCPYELSENEKSNITKRIGLSEGQTLWFSYLAYDDHLREDTDNSLPLSKLYDKDSIVVTGIAKPESLLQYLSQIGLRFQHLSFPDHHTFTEEEARKIESLAQDRFLITTEKDYVRLRPLIVKKPLYYLPVRHHFGVKENEFLTEIKGLINKE